MSPAKDEPHSQSSASPGISPVGGVSMSIPWGESNYPDMNHDGQMSVRAMIPPNEMSMGVTIGLSTSRHIDNFNDPVYTPSSFVDIPNYYSNDEHQAWQISGDMSTTYGPMDTSSPNMFMTQTPSFIGSPTFGGLSNRNYIGGGSFGYQPNDFGYEVDDPMTMNTPVIVAQTNTDYNFSPWNHLNEIPQGRPIERSSNREMEEAPAEVAVAPVLGDLSSIGSAHHPEDCRPCAFFFTKGCVNGVECHFCHEWHPPKKKKPMKEQKNLMIIARPDGKIEFMRCTVQEALRVL